MLTAVLWPRSTLQPAVSMLVYTRYARITQYPSATAAGTRLLFPAARWHHMAVTGEAYIDRPVRKKPKRVYRIYQFR